MLSSQEDSNEPARVSDPRIDKMLEEIKRQEATIAALEAEGHEVTDATRYLQALLSKRDALLQRR